MILKARIKESIKDPYPSLIFRDNFGNLKSAFARGRCLVIVDQQGFGVMVVKFGIIADERCFAS